MSEEFQGEQGGFDINDPQFGEFVPDVDPDADLERSTFGPAEDGEYVLTLKMRPVTDRTPQNPYISKKSTPTDVNLLAVCSVMMRNEEGQGRGFAKDLYLMSKRISDTQKTSSMHYVIKMATGKGVPANTPVKQLAKLITDVFEQAGDDGIQVKGYCRWIRPIIDGYDADGKPQYKDLKGMKRVKAHNIAEIKRRVEQDDSISAEEGAKLIAKVEKSPWIYFWDTEEGVKEMETRVEVAELGER